MNRLIELVSNDEQGTEEIITIRGKKEYDLLGYIQWNETQWMFFPTSNLMLDEHTLRQIIITLEKQNMLRRFSDEEPK
jgi:hypothetical protein